MHHYDVAAKVLIDTCRDHILRCFLHLDVDESTLMDSQKVAPMDDFAKRPQARSASPEE